MEMLPLSSIKTNNPYLRLGGNVETLIESIEHVGLIHPLVINDNDELIAGGRRYTACKNIGLDEVKVVRVDEGPLKEELMSIDENLVRKNLSDLEFEKCLNRGKEIYEELNPTAVEEITIEDIKMRPPSKVAEVEEDYDPNALKTFVQDTAEKTGMSERQVKVAILRDRESSPEVKKARKEGLIGAGHANELIKLDEKTQEEILPFIQEKATSVAKKIVKDVQENGLDVAINKVMNDSPLTGDFATLNNLSKRLTKTTKKIIKFEETYDGEDREQILTNVDKLMSQLEELRRVYQ